MAARNRTLTMQLGKNGEEMTEIAVNPDGSPLHATEARPVAVVENVCMDFKTVGSDPTRILHDVSLTCAPGEFVVLIGKSGCGKTTILNLLAGLIDPSAGTVEVLGTQPRQARRRLAYMFARDALMPWRNAVRNVEYGLQLRGVPRAVRRERALLMLDRVGLDGAARFHPWQLSQGMRQRVALARTWALEPEMLLMDEPFAALDSQTKVKMRAQFAAMWERTRPGVVFVTHDLTEALLLGDRVILVKDGRIDLEVTVPFERPREMEELLYDPEFQDLERQLRNRLH